MNLLRILQIADSAFPSGGFAHSGGLEALLQHGEVGELGRRLEEIAWQCGRMSLPLAGAAWDEPARVSALDARADTLIVQEVARRASRTQGRAWLATARRAFPREVAGVADASHLPVAFGAGARLLGLPRGESLAVLLHLGVRGWLSAAVRLGLCGPLEAQRLQHEAAPLLARVLAACASIPVDDAAQTAPLLEVFQARHDRLYSRLFQS